MTSSGVKPLMRMKIDRVTALTDIGFPPRLTAISLIVLFEVD
jgi:hypothetical protein